MDIHFMTFKMIKKEKSVLSENLKISAVILGVG